MLSLVSRLLMHSLACLAFPWLLGLGFAVYRAQVGPPVAHGVSIGLATWLVYYVFIFFNLLMAVIPRAAIRWGLALLLTLMVLAYFGLQHPVRGPGFAALSAGLCATAILLSAPFASLLRRLSLRWGSRLHAKG